jgi:hypothetical protein
MVPLLLVLFFGDALYMGLWYYIVIPVFAFVAVEACQPRVLFRSGIALGISVTFIVYLSINWFNDNPDGLLGLGHLSSLPGIAVGFLLAVLSLRKQKKMASTLVYFSAFLSVLMGFVVNQVALCNSLMFCGVLTI